MWVYGRIYIIFSDLLLFNAIPSPALDYRFIVLNTVDISVCLVTNTVGEFSTF